MVLRCLPLICALAALVLPAASAVADVPNGKPLYADGPDGRLLMDGQWLFRLDGPGDGVANGFQRQTSTVGWTPISVPNAWNAGDDSAESMSGTIAWYRKDFTLPSAKEALDWIVRFESVNYRSKVWLNGRPLGTHKGAYLPFEMNLAGVKRRGTNRLVIRVDNRRRPTDFPPSGLNAAGVPTGGWWNYGGLTREVYLRRVDTVDWHKVHVKPTLTCSTCPASVELRVTLRNTTPDSRRIVLRGRFGDRSVNMGTATIGANGLHEFVKRLRINSPRLWSPATPNLYDVSFDAALLRGGSKRGKRVSGYKLKTGIRSIKISGDGRLQLNGQFLNFRGVGLHEDTRAAGFAISNADREMLVNESKAIGATLIRTHYPFHPYIHELADRLGLMIWSEIPVYSVKTRYLAQPLVRALALKELREDIEANRNHPSVVVWSLGNELSARPGPTQGNYIRRGAAIVRDLDGTRPVGMALSAYPGIGCQPEYNRLDVIGINEYYGWYPGPGGFVFDRTKLSPYLDSVRQCYPDKAIVVSEFGAEANRDGPVEEKGTWLFQQDFINYHLGVIATKPWLSGAIYWALREFRVRPSWDGGNPRPNPPVHQKGVIDYDGHRKPAYADLQRLFAATPQLGTPAPPRAAAGAVADARALTRPIRGGPNGPDGYLSRRMSAEVELVLLFGGLHVVAIGFGVLLFVMFLRSQPVKEWTNEDGEDGGGGGSRRPQTPPPDGSPGDGLPLPDAVPARVRFREAGRLADRVPRRERRQPAHPPERRPVREREPS